MKRKTTAMILSLLLCMICCSCRTPISDPPGVTAAPPEPMPPGETGLLPPEREFSMKGVWISQFDLAEVYLKNKSQRPREDFTSLMEGVLDSIKEMGFDTVVLQVHPYGDSFYPSAFFPDSRYVTGAYGKAMDYDPFEVVVQLCTQRSLRLHAWINPMRLMREEEIRLLDVSHPLRRCYEDQTGEVTVWEGRCYLDPSYPQVREWIAFAAREICERYAVEGVHIDDYFYPTKDESFDRKSYQAYREQGGELSLADFRRENVSQMVRELYEAVKQTDPHKLFGISPAGNAKSVYESMYADVYRWCKEEGFADYICPQLYYGFEHETCPFEQSLRTWHEICQKGQTNLVVGLTLTKASLAEDPYAGSGRYEWAEHDDVVKRSAEFAAKEGYCKGLCLFSYSYLKDPVSGAAHPNAAKEAEQLLSVLKSLPF